MNDEERKAFLRREAMEMLSNGLTILGRLGDTGAVLTHVEGHASATVAGDPIVLVGLLRLAERRKVVDLCLKESDKKDSVPARG